MSDTCVVPKPVPASPATSTVADPAGMRGEEYACLELLLDEHQPVESLEIGMATGESTRRICANLAKRGGRHTAVDPYQSDPAGWHGQGIQRVADAGLSDRLEVVEQPDFLALPEFVKAGRVFDFVLIDGWHSFDYTLLDLFYADLLLKPGGVVAIHDTGWPAVYKACRFLETHKPYQRLCPPISVIRKSIVARLARRAGQLLRGPQAMREARLRRRQWFSLAAYRKLADIQVPDNHHVRF